MTTTNERLRVISHFPGRLRVRAEKFRAVPAFAGEAAEKLKRAPGVSSVSSSALTGSLLIIYDPRVTHLDQLLSVVLAEGRFSGLEVDEEDASVCAAPVPGERMREACMKADAYVRSRAGGRLDLRTAFPGALALLGLGALVARPFTGPQWYHLMYWSCNFFFHLNPRGRGGSPHER